MLLAEWFAWWGEMAPLSASEHLDSHMVQLLGDPGWTLDRESVLDSWRKLARRENNGVFSSSQNGDPYAPGELRNQMHRVRDWLRLYYGGLVN